MVQPLQLPIQLTSQIQPCRPSSHSQTSSPSSSSSRVRVRMRVRVRVRVRMRIRIRVRPTNRRRNPDLCSSITRLPVVFIPALCNVQRQLHRHLRSTWPPHSHRPAPSLKTLTHPGRHGMVHQQLGVLHWMQISAPTDTDTFVLFPVLCLPVPPSPSLETALPITACYSNNTPQVFYTTQKAQRALP